MIILTIVTKPLRIAHGRCNETHVRPRSSAASPPSSPGPVCSRKRRGEGIHEGKSLIRVNPTYHGRMSISRERHLPRRYPQKAATDYATDIHCDSFHRYGDGFILISDKWRPPPSIFRSVEVCRSRQTVRPQESHASKQAALVRTNATLAYIDQGAIYSPNLWSGHPPAGMMNMMDVETSICSEWCAAWRVTNR